MPDVSSGRGRTDGIDRTSPERVEHDFERDVDRDGPGVERNDDLKNAERMPRLGNEDDKPFNDALGG
jgi:hypothetical protein